jgi:tricarballylate dehydrogenase
MAAHGAHWQPALSGTLNLARTNRFFLGGGKALLNSYYRTAERAGVTIDYDTRVTRLEWDGETCTGVHTEDGRRVRAASVICASGGFEANLAWLARYWGKAAEGFHVRGPAYNDGGVLRELLDAGAQQAGEERGFHAVAVDARSPRYDGGIATRIDSIPFGIVVDRDGRRFCDEGEDIWPKRYASWGRNIALRPGQIAYALWDTKVQGVFLPPMYGTYSAQTVTELAELLGLDKRAVAETVDALTRRWTAAGPRPDPSPWPNRTAGPPPGSTRRRATGPSAWTPRPITPYRCVPGSPSPTSASRSPTGHGSAGWTAGSSGTCSPPGRSCRGTSSPPATSPGSA